MPDPECARPTLIAGAASGPTIGVLSPFVGGRYYGEILEGVARATSAVGGSVIAVQTLEAGSYNADFLGASGFRSPAAWDHVVGFVVIANAVSQEYLEALSAAGKPVVMVGHEYPKFPCPVVLPDNGGIREAVAHLIDHGHRRIAFVGFLSVGDVQDRFQGYLETLKNHGIEPDPSLFYNPGNNHEDGGDRAAQQMLAEGLPSTAVVAATDLNAIGVMRTLAAAGYRLPRDQAIVGFDDIPAARHVIPSLSSVRQSMAVLGQTAVELLLKLNSGQAVPAGRRYVPAPFLIRESCGCPDPALVEGTSTSPAVSAVIPIPAAPSMDAAPVRYPARERLLMSLASLLTPDSNRIEEGAAFTDGVDAITQLVEGAASGGGPAVAHLRHELNALYHLDSRPEHLPAMTGAVRAYGAEIAASAGFRAAGRVEERVHELTLALTDVAAQAQFDDNQYFQALLGTQYEMSMGLLRSHEDDPRALGWLASTPARAGCLGLWIGPVQPRNVPRESDTLIADQALQVAGVFVRAKAQSLTGPMQLTVGEFPPRQMLAVARETPGDVVFVVPIRISSSDWGLLAVVAGVETRVPAGREIVNQSAALLAVALDHEAVVVALKEQEEQLRRSAVYDGLTGLPNRTLFVDRLSRALARTKRSGGQGFAVLFLDLDGFKAVNDKLGHDIGDQLLVEVAHRIEAVLREVDTAARFGGDEFLVLLDGMGDVRSAVAATERLQTALARPYDLAGEQLVVTASVGIAMGDSERYDVAADLLRDADIAMYAAKSYQKGTHATFDVAMHGRAMARLQLEADLRRAIDRGEFALHYQPVVDLGTGSVTAFEAFLRWHHPTRGLLHPDTFLPTAEESGAIVPIGRWVIREACRQLRSWQVAGVVTQDVGISVNISNGQFWHDDLLAVAITCLRDTGLEARHLALEFTETVLMSNPRQARILLDELRQCGMKLQIDNFGTGYSSLECLHSFQVDTLKLDRSFIARLDDPRNAEVVRTMVVMGHNLGLTVIAVGVETAEQRAQLRGLGYLFGQGYLFSRPVAAGIAERVIDDLSGESATEGTVRSG